ncbi:hypothetical protein ACVW0P_000034 [Mucilaginibacter sp. UYNi724]
MGDLELIVHNDSLISIKDTINELDISQSKWGFLFKYFHSNSDSVYFLGHRKQFDDEHFKITIENLSDTIMYADGAKKMFGIFLKLKQLDWSYNRKYISKLWNYYEYPAIIFVKKKDEDLMIDLIKKGLFYEDIIDLINDIAILSKRFELYVLWINGNMMSDELTLED